MKILIVDDIEASRKLLRADLEAEGIETREATDGIAALEGLEHEKADAIISHVLRPRMDGYRLCRELRKSDHLREIPFILYTSAYASSCDEKLALDCGADRYINKAAPIGEILRAIHELTNDPSPRRISGAPPPDGSDVLKEYSEAVVRELAERNDELLAARDEVLKANAELRRQAAELTLAKKAAETARQAKSEFLANTSQKIRTPMSRLIGTLDLLILDESSADRRALLNVAKFSAESLVKLLNEILVFSKMEGCAPEGTEVFSRSMNGSASK
jgi:CheY-like chemotaxis protein